MSFQFSPETILDDVNQKILEITEQIQKTVKPTLEAIPDIILERVQVGSRRTSDNRDSIGIFDNIPTRESANNYNNVIRRNAEATAANNANISNLNSTLNDLKTQAKFLLKEIEVRGGKLITPLNANPLDLKSSTTATSSQLAVTQINPLIIIGGIAAILFFTKS
jgi:hypothetical protein